MPIRERESSQPITMFELVRAEIERGDIEKAEKRIGGLLKSNLPHALKERLRWERERARRLVVEYPYDREEAVRQLREEVRGFRQKELDGWIEKGLVDRRTIESEDRFQRRFIPNLFYADPRLKKRKKTEDRTREEMRTLLNARIKDLIETGEEKRYRIRARITVDLKREGRKVRCWLPFPRVEGCIEGARVISASHEHVLSHERAPQRTVYFEERAGRFFVEFEYTISERFNAIHPEGIAHELPRAYLKEEPPHIIFTPYVRALAKEIVGDEQNLYLKARKIYDWITKRVHYSYVREYCLYDNLSELCLTALKGDCGVQALGFITLCRAVGVPARWESGWYVTPNFAGPHDWALFYCGKWLPVDCSFGGARRRQERLRRFYCGNLDGFRMIANAELGGNFDPPKRHWRSDPWDNQRGEVETAKGNIYYDGFDHNIEVISFEEEG
ncbi:MAG: transglutaminase domain-containing protein [Candidatus Thermoplasmatota archaeon]